MSIPPEHATAISALERNGSSDVRRSLVHPYDLQQAIGRFADQTVEERPPYEHR